VKRCIVGGLTGLLLAAGLLFCAPPASAGCLYGGPYISKCDGPIQPDGSWQRCVAVAQWAGSGLSPHLIPVKNCDGMGTAQQSGDLAFIDPPTHIDG
jgi:hypothetical protein